MTATVLVTPAELSGERLAIAGETYRHLFRARRLRLGDELRVVDGAGATRRGRIESVDRRRAVVALLEAAPSRDPQRSLELVLPPIRPERATWAVEKCTELGVSAIRFVAAARAPRTVGEGSLERLVRVARAALEQSGGARLPAISGVHPWEALPRLLAGRSVTFLDPGGPPLTSGAALEQSLVVGPEGGWEEGERELLGAWGAQAAGLGVRVLRAETAAVVAAGWLLAAPVAAR